MEFQCDFSKKYLENECEILNNDVSYVFKKCCEQFGVSINDHKKPSVKFERGYGGEGSTQGILVKTPSQEEEKGKNKKLIHHEMIHFFQANILGSKRQHSMPIWFSEGMAVAMSGQSIIFKSSIFQCVVSKFDAVNGKNDYIFMDRYISYDMSLKPYDCLYDLWGTLFIYLVTEARCINKAYGADDGPYLSESEIGSAVNILKEYSNSNFQEIILKITGKKIFPYAETLSAVKNFLL